MPDASDSRRGSSWEWVKRLGLLVAILASIAAVITLWLQVKTKAPATQVQILSLERLTTPPELPGLITQVTYKGRSLADLWKLRVRFLNNGDVTLLTEGPRQNVLRGGLDLSFPSSTRVIQLTPEAAHFPHTLSDAGSTLRLTFSQWRVGESADYTIWLGSSSRLSSAPVPSVATRNIVDGEARIVDLTSGLIAGPTAVLDLLPQPIPSAGRLLGGIFAGVFVIASLFVLFGAPIEFVRVRFWRSKWQGAFNEWIDTLPKARLFHRIEYLKKNPSSLPTEEWKGFEGPKFPVESLSFETWSDLIIGLLLSSMTLFASGALMALVFRT